MTIRNFHLTHKQKTFKNLPSLPAYRMTAEIFHLISRSHSPLYAAPFSYISGPDIPEADTP